VGGKDGSAKNDALNWKPAILRLWKRREAKLVLLGLVLVAITQWLFVQLNPEGTVTLEFVEIVTQGRGMEAGTLAKFRLRNESGGDISYFGMKEQEPDCEIRPSVKGTQAEGRPAYQSPDLFTNVMHVWSKMPVLAAGEEVMVYARVWKADGPWRMVMDYNLDGRDWWIKYIPSGFQKWFPLQSVMGREMEVASESVDIKVRGLDYDQRSVLAMYRMFTNSGVTNGMQMIVVTNADGRFDLKRGTIREGTVKP